MNLPGNLCNLVDALVWRASRTPDRLAFTFLNDGEQNETHWTYGELFDRVRGIAALLQREGAYGTTAVLLYPPGLDFIAAFLGCLCAGVNAVPAYPPRVNRKQTRLSNILRSSQARFALASDDALPKMKKSIELDCPGTSLQWLSTNTLTSGCDSWKKPEISPASPAFIQYTSGSTGMPKGVVITHSNLWNNEQLIHETFDQSEESIIVGWLPLYHDMGLIGNVLQPLYSGSRCVLMSPQAFLQRPARWLQAISRYRATTSGGPNFSYDLCTSKATDSDLSDLDLSSWQVAFNGSEPVRSVTLDAFSERFRATGFRASAFRPCYGLAEATLLVAGRRGEGAPSVIDLDPTALAHNKVRRKSSTGLFRRIVSCGSGLPQNQIAIVEQDSRRRCSPGEVGEIWVSGPGVAQGYWNDLEATKEIFHAHIENSLENEFLRTGDLGFLDDGQLFITGRRKDLIIVRGQNHYPQDLEVSASLAHTAVNSGAGAAFSLETGGNEEWVLVQECDSSKKMNFEEVIDAIRIALLREHEIGPVAVVLVRRGTILKTSSGKVQRKACRDAYLRGRLVVLFRWHQEQGDTNQMERPSPAVRLQTVQEIEDWLIHKISLKLGVDRCQIKASDSILKYGMDSLASIEVAHLLEHELHISFSPAALLESETLHDLAFALSQKGPDTSPQRPVHGEDLRQFPLSPGQESLWFLHQLAPASTAYNLAFAARMPGQIDTAALRRVLDALVLRHSALRTVFGLAESAPMQFIRDVCEGWFHEVDVSTWGEEEFSKRLNREASYRFDLKKLPLFRCCIFLRTGKEVVLSFVIHHIITDFWSLALFLNELTLGYKAEIEGRPLALPESAGYIEYVRSQLSLRDSSAGEKLFAYWLRELEGDLPFLDFPTDRPRPPVQTFSGSSVPLRIGFELTTGIKELSKQLAVTPYMTLLAAFQVLLSRYTGQQEIVVGSPASCRTEARWDNVFGYFVNPVALRVDLSTNPSFSPLLLQTRATVLGALANQNYPFSSLAARLQIIRDPSRSPIFQVMFVYEKTSLLEDTGIASFAFPREGRTLNLNGMAFEPLALPDNAALFDLMLSIAEIEGFSGRFQYNTDLFDRDTMERVANHWHELLVGIVANPDTSVFQLPLLTQQERSQLLNVTNSAVIDKGWQTIPDLFQEQTQAEPSLIALQWKTTQLTYAELNRRSNQVAHFLRKRGVSAETLVGVCLRRCPEMVITLLGILKAGGAYLPLDHHYPAERLRLMEEDTQPLLLITDSEFITAFSESESRKLCLDQEWPSICAESAENMDRMIDPGNLAYLIFTSGSTGRPKAVMITHAGAVALCHWSRNVYSREELDGVLASTSICFDLSVFEIFVPLTRGGRVVLVDDILEFNEQCLHAGVRLINTVPSAMAEILRLGPVNVGTINLAGEALSGDLVNQLYRNPAITRVYNLYGPSEDTTYSTYGRMLPGHAPSIGQPILNTQVYFLDRNLEPVPTGAVGQIYIGGAGLARGYWGAAELTAERFLPSLFAKSAGERLYRTGDMARLRKSGDIDFLGRADHQVKVRGYRIELGEIESVLTTCKGIRDAVVICTGEGASRRLVAYVVTEDPSTELDTSLLQEYLRTRVPGYMVPQMIVQLPALPRTARGKLDRKALPLPTPISAFARPNNQTQIALAAIWKEILQIRDVGIRDSFFDLGGHSLLATQVISRVRDSFGREVPLRRFLENPTIESLAVIVDQMPLPRKTAPAWETIKPAPHTGPFKLSYAQQRLWFLNQWDPSSAFYNLSASLFLQGNLDLRALESSLNRLLDRHEVLKTVFMLNAKGQPEQQVRADTTLVLEVIPVPGESKDAIMDKARLLAIEESQKPFDLSGGPLFRSLLLRLAEQEHVLLTSMHHIVSDAWSQTVLMRELGALYSAYTLGANPVLPDLPIQYRDYAAWERETSGGDESKEHLQYWRQQLAGIKPLELLTDHPRDPVQKHRGASVTSLLQSDLVRKLERLGSDNNATLFMVLMAAFQLLLWKCSGDKDIAVGTPIANRSRTETESLIGFFVNTLVFRIAIDPRQDFLAFLSRVRETALQAYAHQNIPFEMLAEELRPERELARSPFFQVVFALQNVPTPELQLPGLKATLTETESFTSKFDLTLFVQSAAGGHSCRMEYDTDLFAAYAIQQMMQRWLYLLRTITVSPQAPLADISLLLPNEKNQILHEWNRNTSEYPRQGLAHAFGEQVLERPDSIALMFGDASLTYRELDRRAKQIAAYLRKNGMGAGDLVGVCLPRSAKMIVAIVAIVMAGGAYLPLDPEYPEDRLAYMLSDSKVRFLIGGEGRSFSPATNVYQLSLNRDWHEIAKLPEHDVFVTVFPDSLAYVMYTSGSTGKPKGIAVTQKNIMRLVRDTDYAEFRAEDVFLQFAPVSFDASTFEIWGALLNGAILVIFSGEPSLRALGQCLKQSKITTLWLTAGLFHLMVEERIEDLSGLRQLIAGGDVLRPAIVQKAIRGLPNCTIINGYGPTECTTFSCCYTIVLENEEKRTVPIGRAITNTQAYPLDDNLQLAPVGIAGELFIGGDGVARGYWSQPALTADRFLPDPFSETPGARLYRTGDIARYLAEGNIEFLGRADSQVKIRGYRVELSEIETVLLRHPLVRDAAVVARETGRGKEIIAYIVPSESTMEFDATTVRSDLRSSLPDYMIPAAVIKIKTLPLTPNGKIDRAALPSSGLESHTEYVPPASPAQHALAAIWSTLLHVERPGIHDNFFDLGGHSLLAIQLLSRVREMFRVEIPIRSFFEGSTIDQLARRIEALQDSAINQPHIVPVSREQRRIQLPTHSGLVSQVH